jgi:hypothetical protein
VGCLQGKTFVSGFMDSNGQAAGDSTTEETTMQKLMGWWNS